MFSDVFSGEGIFEQIVFTTPNCMIRSVLFALGNDSSACHLFIQQSSKAQGSQHPYFPEMDTSTKWQSNFFYEHLKNTASLANEPESFLVELHY